MEALPRKEVRMDELAAQEQVEQEELPEEEEAFGDFAIVAFELASEESDALVYSTVDWGYETEEEAWGALEEMAEAGELEPGDYAVIQLCSGREPISVD
jgi:hypothetical protein